jgi:hypothetical protein
MARSLAYITMVGHPWMAHTKAACDHCGAHKERRDMYYVEREGRIVSQICRPCRAESPDLPPAPADHAAE